MKLAENKNGKLIVIGKYGEETIHLNHTSETISDIKEDVFSPYLVAEEATNFARNHLVTATSIDDALERIDEYIRENETEIEELEDDNFSTHLIGAFELTL